MPVSEQKRSQNHQERGWKIAKGEAVDYRTLNFVNDAIVEAKCNLRQLDNFIQSNVFYLYGKEPEDVSLTHAKGWHMLGSAGNAEVGRNFLDINKEWRKRATGEALRKRLQHSTHQIDSHLREAIALRQMVKSQLIGYESMSQLCGKRKSIIDEEMAVWRDKRNALKWHLHFDTDKELDLDGQDEVSRWHSKTNNLVPHVRSEGQKVEHFESAQSITLSNHAGPHARTNHTWRSQNSEEHFESANKQSNESKQIGFLNATFDADADYHDADEGSGVKSARVAGVSEQSAAKAARHRNHYNKHGTSEDREKLQKTDFYVHGKAKQVHGKEKHVYGRKIGNHKAQIRALETLVLNLRNSTSQGIPEEGHIRADHKAEMTALESVVKNLEGPGSLLKHTEESKTEKRGVHAREQESVLYHGTDEHDGHGHSRQRSKLDFSTQSNKGSRRNLSARTKRASLIEKEERFEKVVHLTPWDRFHTRTIRPKKGKAIIRVNNDERPKFGKPNEVTNVNHKKRWVGKARMTNADLGIPSGVQKLVPPPRLPRSKLSTENDGESSDWSNDPDVDKPSLVKQYIQGRVSWKSLKARAGLRPERKPMLD